MFSWIVYQNLPVGRGRERTTPVRHIELKYKGFSILIKTMLPHGDSFARVVAYIFWHECCFDSHACFLFIRSIERVQHA